MISFKDADLLSVLPENLSQPETQALSAAIKGGLRDLQGYARAAPIYAAIKELPDEALNLLAVELRVQYYEPDTKRSVREGMIKQTVAWYLRGGTGSVLSEYLGTLFQGGRLQEWYIYGGKPYFFKAIVDLALDDVIHVGDGEKIVDRIRVYKNVRSWLEVLEFHVGAEYGVPISYENKVCFRFQFHPRYNLGYLYLDALWRLNGSRRLNGYDSEEMLDFYPVKVRLWAKVSGGARTELAGVNMNERVQVAIKTESIQQVQTGVVKQMEMAERLNCQVSAVCKIETDSYMTKLNGLDGTWKLNGSRKLDGGRYAL
ncbi:Phage tail protein (Tail_P2_I) [[Clostridium] symbiosum]|uniref:Phage tail protein n=1 Tax=[Clostridium] symbiosum ATCC 14940 TaxID=411472 RepID=A0ABC9U1P6_CLOSY|nr:phage tail protein [[Clostridium] symbiosum]ERI79382.1 hypothetical protein CLOSYM_00921 [[Clostridium] symbiosum ATCC 14940]SUY61194.1 Phage tail protein (Tail_P2_I) [[Clostridium] symbiosum]DAJ98916.1 MAG TPA: tail protein [Caudoviricetes sp.]